jgi:cobalt/nickel transport protein
LKQTITPYVWIGLGASLLLALALSPFASSHPDGLEKVSETYGFAAREHGWTLSGRAPLAGYLFPGINGRLSTAFSGAVGTLAIFLLAVGTGKLLKARGLARRDRARAAQSPPSGRAKGNHLLNG